VTRSISRRVTPGDRIGSPAATRRTASTICAGGVSFSRNPARQRPPPTSTLDPDDIAGTAWAMYVERDRAEATFDALTPTA
jgi:hypothetical protein